MQLAHLAELGTALDRAHRALQICRDLASLRLERGELRGVKLVHLLRLHLQRRLLVRVGAGLPLGLLQLAGEGGELVLLPHDLLQLRPQLAQHLSEVKHRG